MDITGTISDLYEYFKKWHKRDFNELHQDIINTIQPVQAFFQGSEDSSTTLQELEHRIRVLEASQGATESDIKKIRNEAASKRFVTVDLAYDSSLEDATPCKLKYNDDLGIGILYIRINAHDNTPNQTYATNQYGYTKFIELNTILNKAKYNGKFDTYVTKGGRAPSSTIACFAANGFDKFMFQANTAKLYFAQRKAITKQNEKVLAVGTIIYKY